MKKITYEFALDIETDEIVSIDDAKPDSQYVYPIKDILIPLVNCFNGTKIDRYWRSETNEFDRNTIFHNNCVLNLTKTKEIKLDEETIIKAHKVLTDRNYETNKFLEQHLPGFRMIPDAIFLDENGKFLCIVEVYNKHAKSEEDINYYKEFNLTAFETTYDENYEQRTITQLFVPRRIEDLRLRWEPIRERRLDEMFFNYELKNDFSYKGFTESILGGFDKFMEGTAKSIDFNKRRYETNLEKIDETRRRIGDCEREIEDCTNRRDEYQEKIGILREKELEFLNRGLRK